MGDLGGKCVIGIDAASNTLTVGSNEDLFYRKLILENVNIPDTSELKANDIEVVVRGYGNNPDGYCTADYNDDLLTITLNNMVWAPAAGQPVVLYRGDRVIAGGYLSEAEK